MPRGPRKHADYEYKLPGDIRLRIERYGEGRGKGWRWIVFWGDGKIETQTTETGDNSSTKREAIIDGKNWIKQNKGKHAVNEAAKRDYKKEYAKFQSSPEKKKYRAELNKYNRDKGTYGNGDGKDASHKGGKISGYEAEGKNRGRREKSRLKGSKRKTEGVAMPTLREFIIREANAELDERLSKRWNIVDAVGPSWGGDGDGEQTELNTGDLRQAVKSGDVDYIKGAIQQVLRQRRENGDTPESKDTLRKLLRIFICVRKKGIVTEDGDYLERPGPNKRKQNIPVGKAQIALHKKLKSLAPAGTLGQTHHLADLIKFDAQFRGIHFGQLQKAASVLKKKGLIRWDGTSKLSLRDHVTTEGDASWETPTVKASELQAKKQEPEPVPEGNDGTEDD